MRFKVTRAVATLLATVGCVEPSSPSFASATLPSTSYTEWWEEASKCAGKEGPLSRITWVVRDGSSFPCTFGTCAALWHADHRIEIAREWVDDEMLVKHEMLHDLLGRPGHPSPPFGGACMAS